MADEAQVARDRFLQEGIRRYGEASAIIDVFRERLGQRLERILNERRNWGSFIPAPGEEGIAKTKFPRPWKWIEVMRRGTFSGVPVVLVIAVWWNPEIDNPPEEGVVLYSQLYDDAYKNALPLLIESLPARVLPSYRPPLMLYLVPDDPLDLDREFGLLLNSLVECKLAQQPIPPARSRAR